jgi:FKBP-type peptidyl-prolyl cis-trans isomerase FkpA
MIKNYTLTILLILAVTLVMGCKNAGQSSSAETVDKDTSYAFGLVLGSQMGNPGLQFDYTAVAEGLKDSLEGNEPRISFEEGIAKLQAVFSAAGEKQLAENKEKSNAFLSENSGKPGITITQSGLQYEVLAEGGGEFPKADDVVRVNYEGTLIDGTVFDSSYQRGEPIEFPLNGVIPGWTEGLQLMKVGSSYKFYIPSDLAYGESGREGIPPNSALIFKVDLLAILSEEELYGGGLQ